MKWFLVLLFAQHSVVLTPVAGGPQYNVYRSSYPCEVPQVMELVNPAPFEGTYTDESINTVASSFFCYTATSVQNGNESAPTAGTTVAVPHGTRAPWYAGVSR